MTIPAATSTQLPPVPSELAVRGLSLHPRTEADDAFLRDVFVELRWDEFAALGWPADAQLALLLDQYRMQSTQYDANYPGAAWGVIRVGDERAGRLFLHYAARDLRVVDIVLRPAYCRQGFGAGLMKAVQAQARQLNAEKVSLHVDIGSPAVVFYQRLGFQVIEERGFHYLMEWRTPTGADRD